MVNALQSQLVWGFFTGVRSRKKGSLSFVKKEKIIDVSVYYNSEFFHNLSSLNQHFKGRSVESWNECPAEIIAAKIDRRNITHIYIPIKDEQQLFNPDFVDKNKENIISSLKLWVGLFKIDRKKRPLLIYAGHISYEVFHR